MSIYRSLVFVAVLFLGLPYFLTAQRETTVSGDLSFVKLNDGLKAVLMPIPQASNTEIIFYVKTGSMYETDSLSGISNLALKILSEKISAAIKAGNYGLTQQNTVFSSNSTTERSIYKFVTTSQNLAACISLIRDTLYFPQIRKAEFNTARNAILQQMEDAKHDARKNFDDKLLKGLYVQDHQKLEILGSPGLLKDFDRGILITYLKKYYVPNNTFATVTGNFTGSIAESTFESDFKPVVKSEFNPESVTKIVDLRPMVYNTQFIVEDTSSVPEFEICWQFPGTNSNFHESYPAFLLTEMLNDKNNFIQVKVAKMGCKKFKIDYDANNFNGILRITMQPSKQNLFSTYQFVINELGRLNKTLLNDVMIGAGKLEFKKEYLALKKTREYPMWIVKHWTFNDESYFPDLLDSVMNIGPNRLEKFVINYLNQSPRITGLRISKADRQALKIDTAFTDLDENVSKYVFTYRQNITSLEGADNNLKLRNLLQWLNLNPDVNAQVNGFSDEHEYGKTTDVDSIMQFIDSMPTFHKVSSDIIKHKSYIRPELARAAKIVRYLYEHGIATDRLCGTAMMFKSENKQEAVDNMKCTITLNKIHKSPSLYEYHYGKKPE